MQRKPLFWSLLSLLCLGGAIYFWHLGDQWQAQKTAARQAANPPATNAVVVPKPQASTPAMPVSPKTTAVASTVTNRFPYRLTNTDQTIGQLIHNDKAILLANALLDTGKPVDLTIPDRLRAPANSGSYVVQARGPLDAPFRALVRDANASIVSYIPNNAYLVRVSDTGAQQISADPRTQSVLPYEPYYKLDASLLKLAMEQPAVLPPNGALNVTVFADAYQSTIANLEKIGAITAGEDRSPFGPVLKVYAAPGTLSAVAALPGVQAVASWHTRVQANDLLRPRLGVSANSVSLTNYLGLNGTNILININDGFVDTNHPDLMGRLTIDLLYPPSTNDNGHGTHVAGTIMGTGLESATVAKASGSVSNANFQGMAPNAKAYIISLDAPDSYLQEQAARTNVFISNNSWNYGGAASYDIAAASYDAAVRDALPEVPGSQPILYVFSAGNDGGGDDSGAGGNPDTILSPGTAKNVITVGAIEQPRLITNLVVIDGITNSEIHDATDSDNQVASYSGRGNVGVSVEGDAGRFKPDVVSPGSYVISDRSTTWDTNAYYNPTNYEYNSFVNQTVSTNSLTTLPPIFVPGNAVQLTITVSSNKLSPSPFPPMPIYIALNRSPTTNNYDFLGTNFVSLPPSLSLTPGDAVFYSVGNTSTQTINFNVQTVLITTNDNGNYFQVLSNLNNTLAPYYRYESGTSMAAAGVSGLLACMQEFFQQRLHLTNSPALMKALLINGARTLGQPYDFQPAASGGNFQGWGLPSLPNSIPPALTNFTGNNGGTMPVQFFDQSPTNVLATGQSKTRNLTLTTGGQNQDLRITLVWTDPPGNPAAGVKLVNDLDLIVTNLDTGDVFFGNDFQAGLPLSQSWDTNGAPNIDSVNNVENVYLGAPLGTNYSITVLGRRVNVNAVTVNTNDIVQDYALVISSGDAGGITAPFTLTDTNVNAVISNSISTVTILSNALPLFNQRVGANSQYTATTNGNPAQWNFYVYTNTASLTNATYTNVAFVTFLPPNLGVPRMGASQEVGPPSSDATRFAGADIDLYVSTDPSLTNLNTNAVANALKSVTRTGSEKVLITGSPVGQVYYVAIKSEDQQGAQFDFLGVATDLPFNQTDSSGNAVVTILTPFPVIVPGGSPGNPNAALILGVSTSPVSIRKVTVTNSVTAQDFGDYIGTLTHGQNVAVLNNHSLFDNGIGSTNETFAYDDSGENIPNTRKSDGPGTLQGFVGDKAADGVWMFTMVNDSSPVDTGSVDNFIMAIQPQPPTNSSFSRTILGNSWFYDYVDVPEDATNLTVSLSLLTQSLDLLIKQGDFPTLISFDKSAVISPPGGSLSITKFESPPLNAGRYYFGIFNPNPTPVTVTILVEVDESLAPVTAVNFLSSGNEPLLDDAVTYSTNHVGLDGLVSGVEVGVRIDHPRESDLVLTLISPLGTRVLLAENRGRLDTNGYGSGVNITNTVPAGTNGVGTAQTNIINTLTNFGTLIINYNFFNIPDDLRVYYDGIRIFDSRLTSGSGTFSVDFGPGSAANVSIIMNEPGTNPSTNGDQWNYSAVVVTKKLSYAIFSDNTNLATVPIKFAVPPFGVAAAQIPAQTVTNSSFEGIPTTTYGQGTVVDGWTVVSTNAAVSTSVPTVVTVTNLADTGSNVLALHNGSISRVLPTIAGQDYTLTFVYHGRPALVPVSWWKAELDLSDSAGGGNDLTSVGQSISYGSGPNAVVGESFQLAGNVGRGGIQKLRAPDAPNLILTNALTMEGWVYSTQTASDAAPIIGRQDDSLQQPYVLAIDFNQLDLQIAGVAGSPDISAPIVPNVWNHVAGTFDAASGLMKLYINGALVNQLATAVIPFGALGSGAGVGIGNAGNTVNEFPFGGMLDEMTLYSNALSDVQLQDVYAAGSAGKCPLIGGNCVVTANVILGSATNTISGIDQWTTNLFSFTATSTNMVLQITPNEDGMLLDSFKLVKNAVANPTNYYLPEESLSKLIGEPSSGDWKLEVLDNRVGATNPTPTLVSWQLSLVLADTVPFAIPLSHAVTQTNFVGPNSITYFQVDVPAWAKFATNILTASSPVNLLFNQNILPTGTNSTDFTLVTNTTSRTVLLQSNSVPPLISGQRYFIGVQNNSTTNTITITFQVNFDITSLTNAIPVTSTIAALNIPRYFQYDVSSNAVVTSFQILNPNGNVELVARKGAPLPDTQNFDYLSSVPGASPQTILVLTNSTPVPLTPGRWYLGVFNNDVIPVTYTIVATEAGPPTFIDLTNGVPFNFTSPPGLALTNFFRFSITNNVPAALFELYNLSGNVDLTLDRNAIPYAQPFFGISSRLGTNAEQIVIRTNVIGTNIIDTWYLGVPNQTATNVSYTIRAVISTNGLLVSVVPIKVKVTLPTNGATTGPTLTWPSVLGEKYQIQVSSNLVTWTNLGSPVVASGPTMTFTDPAPMSGTRYYRLVQVQ